MLHLLAELLGNLAKLRHDDAYIHALIPELLRQGTGHIGQTARLGKRYCFSCYK